jgi:hypothetical protein
MEDHFLYKLAQGLQVSLIIRLFISFASHGLYYFYWFVVAALSIIILKMVENIEVSEDINEGLNPDLIDHYKIID